MGLAVGLEDETETDVIARAVAGAGESLASKTVAEIVDKIVG